MRLILIGASGHGKVCAEIAKLNGNYNDIAFLDDDPSREECLNYPVAGPASDFYKYLAEETEFFVSVGNNEIRRQIQEKIQCAGGKITTLIHPNASVSEYATLMRGSVVMAGAIINPGVQIGQGVIVNTASSVDHDCSIGNFTHVAVGSHICGTVNIGLECWIGAGATVINNLSICDNCMIGAGSVVTKNITEAGTYVGIPVRRLHN